MRGAGLAPEAALGPEEPCHALSPSTYRAILAHEVTSGGQFLATLFFEPLNIGEKEKRKSKRKEKK